MSRIPSGRVFRVPKGGLLPGSTLPPGPTKVPKRGTLLPERVPGRGGIVRWAFVPEDLERLAEVYLEISKLLGESSLLGPTLEDVANDLRRDHLRYFIEQRSPTGERWLPLSPVTIALKGHSTILVDTSDMFRSITQKGDKSHIESISISRGSTITHRLFFGTSDPKASKHQGGVGVPRRQPVGVTDERVDHITQRIADAVIAKL